MAVTTFVRTTAPQVPLASQKHTSTQRPLPNSHGESETLAESHSQYSTKPVAALVYSLRFWYKAKTSGCWRRRIEHRCRCVCCEYSRVY